LIFSLSQRTPQKVLYLEFVFNQQQMHDAMLMHLRLLYLKIVVFSASILNEEFVILRLDAGHFKLL
jgi:hypothetical protein